MFGEILMTDKGAADPQSLEASTNIPVLSMKNQKNNGVPRGK